MTPKQATLKATLVTLLFAVFGFFGALHLKPNHDTPYILTLYILLLVHTFFSVRCFSLLIDPKDYRQIVVDLLLVICYAFLGLNIQDLFPFAAFWFYLFFLAMIKYVMLIGRLSQPRLLRRKLLADLGGLVLMLFVADSQLDLFLELGTGLFVIASFYYLVLNPLYVPDQV